MEKFDLSYTGEEVQQILDKANSMPAGTKLYLHSVSFYVYGPPDPYTAYFLSTNNALIDDQNKFKNAVDDTKIIQLPTYSYDSSLSIGIVIKKNGSYMRLNANISSSPGTGTSTIDFSKVFTDTVTEL